jgi:hypothetical protein
VRHRGQYCYISALLPGHREPTPILRLRYQGSADRWAVGIYLASTGHYTESELPTSFGPKTGTPEEGVDDTFVLSRVLNLAADGAQPGPRTRPRKCERRVIRSAGHPVRLVHVGLVGRPAPVQVVQFETGGAEVRQGFDLLRIQELP